MAGHGPAAIDYTVGPDKVAFFDPEKITFLGVRKNAGPIKLPLPIFAGLGAQMGPDRPNFKSYSHITALQPVGTVPGPFRPTTCGLPGQPGGQPAGQPTGQPAGQLAG